MRTIQIVVVFVLAVFCLFSLAWCIYDEVSGLIRAIRRERAERRNS
jgi:hypothetical protein